MTRRMKNYAIFLKFLYQSNPHQQKAIVTNLTKDQIDVLSEIALNIYKGVFPNKKKYVNTLKPYRSIIYKLGVKSTSRNNKKQLLVRNRKFLRQLLQPVQEYLQ